MIGFKEERGRVLEERGCAILLFIIKGENFIYVSCAISKYIFNILCF